MRRIAHTLAPAVLLLCALAGGSARAEDRYGPPPLPGGRDSTPMAMLTWPGKDQSATAPVQPISAQPRARLGPAADAPPAPRPLPTSIYAPPPAPVAPAPANAAGGLPPRFYSVSRQYGVQPDPIALSPQFLADSSAASLAEPPSAPTPHANAAQTANLSAAAATAQSRAAAESALAGDPAASN
jgi:hypothetical protein